MKRKLLIVLLSIVCCFCLAFGLTACNKGTTSGGTSGGTEQSGTEQGDTEQGDTEQSDTEQGDTEQSGTEQGDDEQGDDEQSGTEQGGDTEQGGTEQGGTEITVTLNYSLSDDGNGYVVSDIGNVESETVTIPETYDGKPVTGIADNAFSNNTVIAVVVIPESVTSIGDGAFSGCTSLTTVTIGDGVTIISDSAFSGCTNLENVTLGANVQTIGLNAFKNCIALVVIVIGDNVTSIGANAFSGCTKLNNITIGSGVQSIGSGTFSGCSSLESITIPSSVTSIGANAFANCTKIVIVIILGNPEIGSGAFAGCTLISDITLSDELLEKLSELLDELFGDSAVIEAKDTSGETHKIESSDLEFTISGDGTYYTVSGIGTCTDKKIAIPSTYNGLSVTSIGDEAFYNCSSLASVVIPDSVISIGNSAFSYCYSLESITIPDGVTTIGNYAFYYCSSLESVTVGSGVTSIGYNAFVLCYSLTDINVSSENTSYKSIDGNLYSYDGATIVQYARGKADTSFAIPDGVTVISENAFYMCVSLISITIPDGVTSINEYAFAGCYSLTGIIIPDSVTTIEAYAFDNCWSLTSVTIGSGVTSIYTDLDEGYGNSFGSCRKLIEVYNRSSLNITAGSPYNGYVAAYAKNVYTETSGSSNLIYDGDYIFYNDGGSYYLVTYAGTETELTLPENINGNGYAIYDYAFYYWAELCHCVPLVSVVIPDSVTSIGMDAFYCCYSLTSITIGSGVTSIGFLYIEESTGRVYQTDAFTSCVNLIEVYINSSIDVTEISSAGGGLLDYAKNVYTKTSGSSNLIYEGDYIFYNDNGTYYLLTYTGTETELTLPDSINGNSYKIYDCAFLYRTSLKSVIIPYGVTAIGESAFAGCISLKSVYIADSVTSIDQWAFQNCFALKNISIGSGVTYIGSQAFYGTAYYNNSNNWENNVLDSGELDVLYVGNYLIVANFHNIVSYDSFSYVIKDGTTVIADNAFYRCTRLASITIPDSVVYICSGAFYRCTGLTSVTIPSNVTYIGGSAFEGCSSLTNVTIPNSVTYIGGGAFYGCTSLAGITLSDSLTSIGYQAFYNTAYYNDSTNWEDNVLYMGNYLIAVTRGISGSYTIKDGTTVIANQAFGDCTLLESIIIPDSVISISDYAFYYCTSLTSISIGSGVTSIGMDAFFKCTKLESIIISDNVTYIGITAFSNCTALTNITIGSGVMSIGVGAFYECSNLTSVIFENTSGWYVNNNIAVSDSDLQNASTAAEYLTSTYYKCYWYRSVSW